MILHCIIGSNSSISMVKLAILGYSHTFLDLFHLLEGVNGPNLFLRHPKTFADVVEGMEEAVNDKYTINMGCCERSERPGAQRRVASAHP